MKKLAMKNQTGFSLIELLIVVVIIGIVAAIAVPNLLSSRRASNEASAISSLRTYGSAQLTYQSTAGAGNFAGAVGTNGFYVLTQNSYLSSNLQPSSASTDALKSGYSFNAFAYPASNGKPSCHLASANPIVYQGVNATGSRDFALGTDGIIYITTAYASPNPANNSGVNCDVNTGIYNPLN